MHIVILDTETTLHSDRKDDLSTPHDPNNEIVWIGSQSITDGREGGVYAWKRSYGLADTDSMLDRKVDMLVGHNIKYDLLYMAKVDRAVLVRMLEAGVTIWDTQLAEYLITAQESRFVSLDAVAKKYGGTIKDDRLKEYWEAGFSTEDIDDRIVHPYLIGDINNTRTVFYAQVKKAQELGMLPLIRTQMDALLATTLMEQAGIHIDDDALCNMISMAKARTLALEGEISVILDALHLTPDQKLIFNPGSNQHIAALIYGGKITGKVMKDTGEVYKSGIKKGTPKLRNVDVTIDFPAPSLMPPILFTEAKNIKVDADTLTKDVLPAMRGYPKLFIETLLELKLVQKELNTYYLPLKERRWATGLIHPQLHHTNTVTGRLSSSKPNFQNMPRGSTAPVKKCMSSRWGSDGLIIEADYSQLEVVALAFLSQDPRLIRDIEQGVDTHLENAAKLFRKRKEDVTKEERTKAKIGTFQLQYGAGAATISAQSGLTLKEANDLIEAYYIRYPKVQEFHHAVHQQVKANRKSSTKKTAKGYPAGRSEYISCTGRRYHFYEYDAPQWLANRKYGTPIYTAFSPTEMKNYLVQGLATADIVPLMLGKIARNVMPFFIKGDIAYMINTVHDSIIFDVRKSHADLFIEDLKHELKKVHDYMLDIFGIEFNIPLRVEIEGGESWGNLTMEF